MEKMRDIFSWLQRDGNVLRLVLNFLVMILMTYGLIEVCEYLPHANTKWGDLVFPQKIVRLSAFLAMYIVWWCILRWVLSKIWSK